jgi:hypothetical protein
MRSENRKRQENGMVFPGYLWYNGEDNASKMDCRASLVRSSPPKGVPFRRTAGHQGLTLPVVLLTSQVCQLDNVVTDRQRVGHDAKNIVDNAQEMVVVYHSFLLRAYGLETARRLARRAAFARRQARYTPRKPGLPITRYPISSQSRTKVAARPIPIRGRCSIRLCALPGAESQGVVMSPRHRSACLPKEAGRESRSRGRLLTFWADSDIIIGRTAHPKFPDFEWAAGNLLALSVRSLAPCLPEHGGVIDRTERVAQDAQDVVEDYHILAPCVACFGRGAAVASRGKQDHTTCILPSIKDRHRP